MPRARKGARLWLRPARRSKDGGWRAAAWIILDDGDQHATGCGEGARGEAEKALADHIAAKHDPGRRERDLTSTPVADVISVYLDHLTSADPPPSEAVLKRLSGRMDRLLDFWGKKSLADVTGKTCRDYAKERGKRGGARRDLEDFRAAINHHAKEGLHRALVRVTLPAKGAARSRWLTRSEAARLIWTCWRAREQQRRHRGADKGRTLPTDKRPLQHIARFILLGIYTGSARAPLRPHHGTPHPGAPTWTSTEACSTGEPRARGRRTSASRR